MPRQAFPDALVTTWPQVLTLRLQRHGLATRTSADDLVKVWAFRQTLHLLTSDDLPEFVVAARSLERWHTPVWLRYFKIVVTPFFSWRDGVRRELKEEADRLAAFLDRPLAVSMAARLG